MKFTTAQHNLACSRLDTRVLKFDTSYRLSEIPFSLTRSVSCNLTRRSSFGTSFLTQVTFCDGRTPQ